MSQVFHYLMYFHCPNVILTSNYYNYYYEKKDNYIQAAKYYYNGSRLICLTVWFFVNPHIFHLKYGQLILIELLLYM